ncbi:FkbM family methyltransferase [Pedobacter sp. ASV12]|uniref:FkbM family methyltransferase n=1 Tax=Pedobacter sp. ASV12 TaxID=2795120 RepID=UPI0018ECE5E1|nr:FkbM family methyltransferase [Pedobacter sp. ASV12]
MKFKGKSDFEKIILAYARGFNHPFKLRFLNWLINSFYKSGLRLQSTSGRLLQIAPNDFIGHQLIYHGCYEPISLQLALRLLNTKPNAVFIDVGANMGLYTINAGAIDGLKIYAIEPVAKNFVKLQANYALNSNQNSTAWLINLGLSDTNELAYISNPVESNEGTYRVEDSEQSNAQLIALTTLDELVTHFKIDRIDLLKMDVEGFEGKIIAGFKSIGKVKPQNILMEYSDYVSRTGISKTYLYNYFIELGYESLDVNGMPYAGEGELMEDNIWFRLK